MKEVKFENIEEVWKEFFECRSEHCRNLLMENYLQLVKYTADRIYAKLPDKVELDDLVSAGIFGLMDAIDAFDPERGVKFATYCTPRVRGSILDELRSMDWVPRLILSRALQLEGALQTLEAHLGRMPTDDEIAAELKLDEPEFRRLQRDVTATGLVSLNNKFSDSDGEKDVREIDVIEDQKSKDPLIEAQKRDLKSLLTKGLTRNERLIVVLYYYEKMAMKEIGATLDLSESRVLQMHASIIARLMAQMNSRRKEFSVVGEFNDDRLRSACKSGISDDRLRISYTVKQGVSEDAIVDAIVDFYRALNAYHIAFGGNGLLVDRWQTIEDPVLAGATQ